MRVTASQSARERLHLFGRSGGFSGHGKKETDPRFFETLCTMVRRRIQIEGEAARDGSKGTTGMGWTLDEKYKPARFKAVTRLDALQIISARGSADTKGQDFPEGWHLDYIESLGVKVQVPLVSVEKDMGPIELVGDNFLEFVNLIWSPVLE